jgi:predicted membrane protein
LPIRQTKSYQLIGFEGFESSEEKNTMTQKTLKLFQLFLEVFVVYAILKAQMFTALLCLVVIFLIGRYEKTTSTVSISEEGGEIEEEANQASCHRASCPL